MQNAMLDSTVSSNSQELFDFNARHNGEGGVIDNTKNLVLSRSEHSTKQHRISLS